MDSVRAMTKTAKEMLHNFALTYRVESKESRNQCLDQALEELEAIIRNEKQKLLAEVRERVVGEDKPLQGKYRASGLMSYDMTNHYENSLRAEQRAVLTQLEAEL